MLLFRTSFLCNLVNHQGTSPLISLLSFIIRLKASKLAYPPVLLLQFLIHLSKGNFFHLPLSSTSNAFTLSSIFVMKYLLDWFISWLIWANLGKQFKHVNIWEPEIIILIILVHTSMLLSAASPASSLSSFSFFCFSQLLLIFVSLTQNAAVLLCTFIGATPII